METMMASRTTRQKVQDFVTLVGLAAVGLTTSTMAAGCAETCTVGAERCGNGEALQFCDTDGSWETQAVCEGLTPKCYVNTLGKAACAASCADAAEGDKRCGGAQYLEVCTASDNDLVWQRDKDCFSNGQSCIDDPSLGGALCQGLGSCTFNGHTASGSAAFWDPLLRTYGAVWVYDNLSNPAELLQIENWPAFPMSVAPGTSAEVQLTGTNAAIDTCGVCVKGQRVVSGSDIYFFAQSGSATVTAPTQLGDVYTVTLTNVVMTETNAAFSPIANGATWCIDSLQLPTSLTSETWPCSYIDNAYELKFGTDQPFNEGNRACVQSTDLSVVELWECVNGGLELVRDCASFGETCAPPMAGTEPSCQ
jgi:hypothetical protein